MKAKDIFDLLTVSDNPKVIEKSLDSAVHLLEETLIPEEVVVLLNILHKRRDTIETSRVISEVERFMIDNIEELSDHEAAKVFEKLNLNFKQ